MSLADIRRAVHAWHPKASKPRLVPQHLIDAAAPRVRAASKPKERLRVQPSAAKAKSKGSFVEYEQRRQAEAQARGRATMRAMGEAARQLVPVETTQPKRSSVDAAAQEAAQVIMGLVRGGQR